MSPSRFGLSQDALRKPNGPALAGVVAALGAAAPAGWPEAGAAAPGAAGGVSSALAAPARQAIAKADINPSVAWRRWPTAAMTSAIDAKGRFVARDMTSPGLGAPSIAA